jgi:trehalose 6-phosphate synthase
MSQAASSIAGLLGSSVLGFHTQFHCNNFIDTSIASVTVSGHETFVRPYPISIEWPPAALAGDKSVAQCRASARAQPGSELFDPVGRRH